MAAVVERPRATRALPPEIAAILPAFVSAKIRYARTKSVRHGDRRVFQHTVPICGAQPRHVMRARTLCLFTVLCFNAFACAEHGDGVLDTRTQTIRSATLERIVVGDILHATIVDSPEDGVAQLTISGDSNLLDHIQAVESGGTLEIRVRGNVDPRHPMSVTIPAGALRVEAVDASDVTIEREMSDVTLVARDSANLHLAAVVSGSIRLRTHDDGDIELAEVEGADLDIEARDSSKVVMRGTCAAMVIRATDAANVQASALACIDASVNGSDAARVGVCAAQSDVSTRDAARVSEDCSPLDGKSEAR